MNQPDDAESRTAEDDIDDEHSPTRSRVERSAVAVWVAAAIVLVVALIFTRTLLYDSLSCRLPGYSSYGTPGWSWVPFGKSCTYPTEWETAFTVGPTPAIVVLQTALAASAVGYLIGRLRRRSPA
ncbi:MAG: hypothetical protein ACT4QF_23230 [Sporichthyaceae bacterium]